MEKKDEYYIDNQVGPNVKGSGSIAIYTNGRNANI